MSECESCGYRIPPEATHCPACANAAPARPEPPPAPVFRSTGPEPVRKKASPVAAVILLVVVLAFIAGVFLFGASEKRKADREFQDHRRLMERELERAGPKCEVCSGSGTMTVSETPEAPARKQKCILCGGTGVRK